MPGGHIKISQELTIIEAGHWVNKGSLNSFLDFCICLNLSIIKKLLKEGWGGHRYNLKITPSVLHSPLCLHTGESGKCSDQQPRRFMHSQS